MHGDSGSWAGATRAPEGKDNVKDQACLGCKRNVSRAKSYGKDATQLPVREILKIGMRRAARILREERRRQHSNGSH